DWSSDVCSSDLPRGRRWPTEPPALPQLKRARCLNTSRHWNGRKPKPPLSRKPIMDLNELLRQHQIALINDRSAPGTARNHGFSLVRHYARRIADLRAELGVRQY